MIDARFKEAAKELDTLVARGEPVRTIVLPRDFGEATALAIGFEQARGEILVTLPAYYQTAPEGIERLLGVINEGLLAQRFDNLFDDTGWEATQKTRPHLCLASWPVRKEAKGSGTGALKRFTIVHLWYGGSEPPLLKGSFCLKGIATPIIRHEG